jgi:hypothetical protein
MRQLWRVLSTSTIEALVGRVDCFHGTDVVLSPPGRATGVVTVHDLSFLRTPRTVTAEATLSAYHRAVA